MKFALPAIAAFTCLAAPALAQNDIAPAAPAAPAAPTAPAAPAVLSLDTPIEALAADPRSKAVLDARLPGLTAHPSYPMFKAMSLREVQPYSQGAITDELLAAIGTDLAAIRE